MAHLAAVSGSALPSGRARIETSAGTPRYRVEIVAPFLREGRGLKPAFDGPFHVAANGSALPSGRARIETYAQTSIGTGATVAPFLREGRGLKLYKGENVARLVP